MQIDIKGKIKEKKLSYSNTLLPLYEAIVNSIQSIDEKAGNESGVIEVDLIRSQQKSLDFEGTEVLPDIIDFVIHDNGIGFNEANYDSFNHAHSTYKPSGKGIGRFTWLKAFQKAEIESFYHEGEWKRRAFNFEPTKKGIENDS